MSLVLASCCLLSQRSRLSQVTAFKRLIEIADRQLRHRDCTIEPISDTVLAWRRRLICFYYFLRLIPPWLLQVLMNLIYSFHLKLNQFIGVKCCLGFLFCLLVRHRFLVYLRRWLYLKSNRADSYLTGWFTPNTRLRFCFLALHHLQKVFVELPRAFILAVNVCAQCFLWLAKLAGLHAWRQIKAGSLYDVSTAQAFELDPRWLRQIKRDFRIYFQPLKWALILLWCLISKLALIITFWAKLSIQMLA